VIFGFRDVYILPAVITCAFEICRKTLRLKTDANRFISGTVTLPGIQKAQLMTVLRIILRNEAGVYADNN